MASRYLVSVCMVLLTCMPSSTPAAYGRLSSACCMSYSRRPLPFYLIKGFSEQSRRENCHIQAVIFYTFRNRVCANPQHNWVRKALAHLSAKLKKMSKGRTAMGAAPTTQRSGISGRLDRS